MRKINSCLVILLLFLVPALSVFAEPFDGESVRIREGEGEENELIFVYSSVLSGYVLQNGRKCVGEVYIPSDLEGIPVVRIEDYAFYGNRNVKGELYLPSSIREIGNYAFSASSFTGDLFIPESVVKIGRGAFFSSSFDGLLYLTADISIIEPYTFAETGLTGPLILPSGIREIREGAFEASRFSGELIFNEGLETIGPFAFADNRSLESDLIIPSSVRVLSASAFNYCSGLNGHYIMNGRGCYEIRGLDKVEVVQ